MTIGRLLLKYIVGKKNATKISPKAELTVSKFPPARERVLDVPRISILVAG
jgi:hypothetical protein